MKAPYFYIDTVKGGQCTYLTPLAATTNLEAIAEAINFCRDSGQTLVKVWRNDDPGRCESCMIFDAENY